MFFERHQGGERAVLVQLQLEGAERDLSLVEFEELVVSAGGNPVATLSGSRRVPHARTFVGEGKLAEIADKCREHEAELVIFNHALSPSQERNLEQVLACRVLARTGLILDIFAQRARTHEGKLQVELAQLTHMSTRLVRGWTHLERQKGGIGLRGPGETQLETDRRLLRARIKSIQARLQRVRNQREQSRRARRRAELPILSLVGYTNAGKSTLFNRVTASRVYAANKLFATLDPTLARVDIEQFGPVLFADTVGFISDLPTMLVEAFKATLEETANADLLLHVVDVAAPNRDVLMEDVETVLGDIEADTLPQLVVFNKLDLVEQPPRIERNETGTPMAVYCSAATGEGMELLLEAIRERLAVAMFDQEIALDPSRARLRSALYELGAVSKEEWQADGSSTMHVRLPLSDWRRLNV
ncbi:GTPase HflX [Luminiphilus sp.]|nr:GTPase HflX [Luminiphilus sp.]MDB4049246.1 GTPase HflX [Luminiphilus sp.]MDC1117159.1 GTPase HflX [Luminiphilus sp.]